MQGGEDATIAALRHGDINAAHLDDAEDALMRFVQLVTNRASQTTASHAQALRDAGWTDPQIAEAVYVTALFAFFNRVADAFGLEDPNYLEQFGENLPPNLPGKA